MGCPPKDQEAILLDPQKVLDLEVAEISLGFHTVEFGHLIDGTETKTGKSEVEINFSINAATESLLDYPWSSLSRGYAVSPQKRPSWLKTDDRFGILGLE